MDQAQIDIAKNTKDIKHIYEETPATYAVTSDTEVVGNKQYFIKDGNAYNVIIPEEGANPQALGYYELVSGQTATGVLANEIVRAKAKENAIATDLTGEIARATGAEAELEAAISQVSEDLGTRIQPIEKDVEDLKNADIIINDRIDNIYKSYTAYSLTSDEAPDTNKTYYTKDGEEYKAVESPSGNPKELGYYEIKTVTSGVLANEIKRSEEKDAQLTTELAELESDVGTIGNLGMANKAAIEKIYKETEENGETKASGLLVEEIKRATLAEEGLSQAIADEVGRATAKENELAGDIAALESADTQHAAAIENNTKAIEAIYKFTPAEYASTSDESVVGGKTYYSQIDGTYIPVSNPVGNPKELGYFEISVAASETGELTKYELKTTAEAKLTAAIEYTDSAIAGVEGIIGELQTDIGKLENVMNFVGSLVKEDDNTENGKETAYEITDITSISNTENINITSKKPFEKGDVGIWNQQEYVCIEPGNLNVDVYTSIWTAIGDVSAFSASINGLEERKLDKEVYETDTAELSKTIAALQSKDAELESAIGEEADRAIEIENGLNVRLTAVENSIEYIAYVSTNDTKVNTEKSYYQFVNNQYEKVTTFEENANPKELGYFEIDSDSSGLRMRLNTAEKDIDINTQAIASLEGKMESEIQQALTWGTFDD